MRAVIQRVKTCSVAVDGDVIAAINAGLLVLLGVARRDDPADADYLVDKVCNLRIFEDAAGKMNRSLLDTSGEMLVVSQFTLLADCRKGRRPSFIEAAEPDIADALYQHFAKQVRQKGLTVKTGRFGAMMAVSLVNDGPVTIVLDSKSS